MGTSKKMKLVHIATGKQFRGGERQVLWLHEGLAEKGIESTLICSAGSALATKSKINTHACMIDRSYNIIGLGQAFSFCKKNRPHIIHCHDSKAFTLGYAVSLFLNIPLIYTRRSVFRIRQHLFNRLKYRHCAHVIAISSAVVRHCLAVCPKEHISIIPDGLQWSVNHHCRNESRKRLGICKDSFVIGTVGYFTKEKNFPFILSLASLLYKEYPHVTIVCIGEVPEHYHSTVGRLCNVITPGIIENAPAYYRAFDLYVSASTSEGLGTALLDACARDIPSIAFDSGGTQDIYPKGYPLHIPQGNHNHFIQCVRDCITDPNRYTAEVTKLGKQVRETFSLSAQIEKHCTLYSSLV